MTGIYATMEAKGNQAAANMEEVIETRFGPVTVQRHSPVIMPRGPLGMADKMHFCIADFPSAKMQRFKLLQSLDDTALSFITLPLETNNPIISSDDIATACKDLGIELRNLALLAIVSVHRTPDSVKLSVNARAPIFVDTSNRLSAQYVFNSDKYLVQHFISN